MPMLRHRLAHTVSSLISGAMPTAIFLAITLLCQRFGSRLFHTIERWFGRIARHRALSVLFVGLFSFVLNAAMSVAGDTIRAKARVALTLPWSRSAAYSPGTMNFMLLPGTWATTTARTTTARRTSPAAGSTRAVRRGGSP